MADLDPEVCAQVYVDWEYRKIWDNYVLGQCSHYPCVLYRMGLSSQFCLSVYLSVRLSVHLSVCPSLCLSDRLRCVKQSVLSFYLSATKSIWKLLSRGIWMTIFSFSHQFSCLTCAQCGRLLPLCIHPHFLDKHNTRRMNAFYMPLQMGSFGCCAVDRYRRTGFNCVV